MRSHSLRSNEPMPTGGRNISVVHPFVRLDSEHRHPIEQSPRVHEAHVTERIVEETRQQPTHTPQADRIETADQQTSTGPQHLADLAHRRTWVGCNNRARDAAPLHRANRAETAALRCCRCRYSRSSASPGRASEPGHRAIEAMTNHAAIEFDTGHRNRTEPQHRIAVKSSYALNKETCLFLQAASCPTGF